MLLRETAELVEIDKTRLAVDAVADDRVEVAREVDLVPVRQVAAVVEPHREDRVPGLEAGEVDRHVGLRARVGLDVCVLRCEKSLRTVDRELLDPVDDLAASVVPPSRVALRVLVRRHRARCLEHARPGEVLRRDQLDLATLALELSLQQLRDLRVDLGQPGAPEDLEALRSDSHPRRS
jgi:hypothetical protein